MTKWRKTHKAYHQAYMKAWRLRHPDVTLRERIKLYSLSLEGYKILLEVQNNRCAICKREFKKSPCIDHDHVTGRVRGLLCRACNFMLGGARDSINTLRSAIVYLEEQQR